MTSRVVWAGAVVVWSLAAAAQADDVTSPVQPVTPAPQAAPAPAGTLLLERGLAPLAATGQTSMQVRANVLGSETLRAGPLIDLRGNRTHRETPSIASRQNNGAVQLGGFVDYLFVDPSGAPPSSIGFGLQVGSDPVLGTGQISVQPGVDYLMPLSPSWQLSTRLFSTYTPEHAPVTGGDGDRGLALRTDVGNEPGFRDFGIGLGLGYSVSDRWQIQTQARYQRSLDPEQKASNDPSPHQFFGGVMIDYKF